MVSGFTDDKPLRRQPPLCGQLGTVGAARPGGDARADRRRRTLLGHLRAAFGPEQPAASNADAAGRAHQPGAWKWRRCRGRSGAPAMGRRMAEAAAAAADSAKGHRRAAQSGRRAPRPRFGFIEALARRCHRARGPTAPCSTQGSRPHSPVSRALRGIALAGKRRHRTDNARKRERPTRRRLALLARPPRPRWRRRTATQARETCRPAPCRRRPPH